MKCINIVYASYDTPKQPLLLGPMLALSIILDMTHIFSETGIEDIGDLVDRDGFLGCQLHRQISDIS